MAFHFESTLSYRFHSKVWNYFVSVLRILKFLTLQQRAFICLFFFHLFLQHSGLSTVRTGLIAGSNNNNISDNNNNNVTMSSLKYLAGNVGGGSVNFSSFSSRNNSRHQTSSFNHQVSGSSVVKRQKFFQNNFLKFKSGENSF